MSSVVSEMDMAIAPGAERRTDRGVQVIRTLADLDGVASTWEELAVGRNPVSGFAYARAWAAGLDSAQRLAVLSAGGRERPAIAPLVMNRGGAGWLTLLAAEMYEIMDFLYGDETALGELARAIARTGRPLELKRVPADSPAAAALEAAYRGRGVVRRQAAGGSPWIPLDESWHEPEMRLEAGRRSDLRRARRQAEKMGAVEAVVIAPRRDELAATACGGFSSGSRRMERRTWHSPGERSRARGFLPALYRASLRRWHSADVYAAHRRTPGRRPDRD